MRKFLPFFLLLLCSCSSNFNTVTQNKIDVQEEIAEKYTLNYEYKAELSTLEPKEGCVLGFYTQLDIDNSIEDFENTTNITANHYVYEYILGTDFSDNFMLECLANKKTPYIKVTTSKYNMYDIIEIYNLSKKLKSYDTPCYIELFPNPLQIDYTPDKYKQYFEKSSNILKSSLTDCSIIFTPNNTELFSSSDFYPNKDSYDFVGFEYIGYVDDNENFNNFFNKFDYVYYENYTNKPIFITKFAISYFSDSYNTYYVNENIDFLNHIAKEISENYYNVKGINFYNIDAREQNLNNDKYNNDNYMLTENEKILKNLQLLTKKYKFISNFEKPDKIVNEKYVYNAIYINDIYYVSDKFLDNPYLPKMNYDDNINSYIFEKNNYIDLYKLFESNENFNIFINNEKNSIIIKQK